MRRQILVVDDDEQHLECLGLIINYLGCDITTTSNSRQGVQLATARDFDLIIVNVHSPGLKTAQVVHLIKAIKPACRVVVVGTPVETLLADELRVAGIDGVLKKPYQATKILNFLGE